MVKKREERGIQEKKVHSIPMLGGNILKRKCLRRKKLPGKLVTCVDLTTNPISLSINIEHLGVKDFPGGSGGKGSAYNTGDPGSLPGSGRSPGEGNGNPLQYSCLENPMD